MPAAVSNNFQGNGITGNNNEENLGNIDTIALRDVANRNPQAQNAGYLTQNAGNQTQDAGHRYLRANQNQALFGHCRHGRTIIAFLSGAVVICVVVGVLPPLLVKSNSDSGDPK